MQAYVTSDNRPLTRTYDKGLSAVNAPNVKHQATTEFVEPFQPRTKYPLGQPPVRYPDVTTIPGFKDDPRQDEMDARNVAGRAAERFDTNDPMPHDWRWDSEYRSDYQKDTSGSLSRDEALRRIMLANTNNLPLTAW